MTRGLSLRAESDAYLEASETMVTSVIQLQGTEVSQQANEVGSSFLPRDFREEPSLATTGSWSWDILSRQLSEPAETSGPQNLVLFYAPEL